MLLSHNIITIITTITITITDLSLSLLRLLMHDYYSLSSLYHNGLYITATITVVNTIIITITHVLLLLSLLILQLLLFLSLLPSLLPEVIETESSSIMRFHRGQCRAKWSSMLWIDELSVWAMQASRCYVL